MKKKDSKVKMFDDDVKTREDFIKYLRYLSKDFENHKDEESRWQNWTIGDFLESISSWLEDNEKMIDDKVSWKDIAGLFHAGKVYE